VVANNHAMVRGEADCLPGAVAVFLRALEDLRALVIRRVARQLTRIGWDECWFGPGLRGLLRLLLLLPFLQLTLHLFPDELLGFALESRRQRNVVSMVLAGWLEKSRVARSNLTSRTVGSLQLATAHRKLRICGGSSLTSTLFYEG
jgi:hypothetical protein